jgi:flagella basal body P-ring formation protein FlgA
LKYLTTLLFLVCSLTFSPDTHAKITVNFQAEANVTDARIVLADIAVITPAGSEANAIGQLPVAAAPAPGALKQLSTVSVITALRNRPEVADVDWQGSETITVQRQGNRLNHEQLQQIIADFLKENSAKLPKTEIRFTSIRLPEELIVPSGKLSWKVTPSNPEIMGSSSFSIAFTVDGKPAGSCIVRGKLEALAEVATAEVTLRKGDLITKENIALKQQNIGSLDKPFLAVEPLVGMQVARTINIGKAIEQKHIVSPPIIKEGDQVKIFARRGDLQISTSGIAKANGRLGETIRIKNVSSNKLIYCRVDGPGIVSVEF